MDSYADPESWADSEERKYCLTLILGNEDETCNSTRQKGRFVSTQKFLGWDPHSWHLKLIEGS